MDTTKTGISLKHEEILLLSEKVLQEKLATALGYDTRRYGPRHDVLYAWNENKSAHIEVPDFCRDLNAMREVERRYIVSKSKLVAYDHALGTVALYCGCLVWELTAHQKAAAMYFVFQK